MAEINFHLLDEAIDDCSLLVLLVSLLLLLLLLVLLVLFLVLLKQSEVITVNSKVNK